MEIDFIKNQNPQKNKKESGKAKTGVDYTKPVKEEPKKPVVKKNTEPKVSLWQRIKNIFKRKEKKEEPQKSYPYSTPPKAPVFTPPLKPRTKITFPPPKPKLVKTVPPVKSYKPLFLKQKPAPLPKAEPKIIPKPAPKPIVFPKPVPPPIIPPKPIPQPKPMPVINQPAPTPAPAPVPKKPLIQADKQGIVAQPALTDKDNLVAINKKELEKIKKGDYAKGFLGVNLLPGQKHADTQATSKMRSLLWAAIASMAVILLASGGMIIYQANLLSKVNETKLQINQLDGNIAEYEPWQKEALAFNQKVENIITLLDKHIYWTNFFSLLEQYTLPDVYYTSLTGDVSGTFTLAATAPDFETVSQQIALFKQADFISKVSVVSANMSTETVEGNVANTNVNAEQIGQNQQPISFNVSLTVKPEIFYYGNDLWQ
ncbi:MAG: hypothetical protein WC752_04000 [Patescibacteria group bacterium]|jgi:hypothetical protein